MTRLSFTAILIGTVAIATLDADGAPPQDKYALKVPDGLAFADFKGYEDWPTVAVSQTESQNVLRAILANPVMMKAYREGVPGNGKPFPDGSKMAKILWTSKKVTDDPWTAETPDTMIDTLNAVEFIEKDSQRFPDAHGWGYAKFAYDPAADTFTPAVKGVNCGAACHEKAGQKRDYLFTSFGKR